MIVSKLSIYNTSCWSYWLLFGDSNVKEDIDEIVSLTSRFYELDWFRELHESRRVFIISLVYKVGLTQFIRLKNTMKCLENGGFSKALCYINDSTIWEFITKKEFDELLSIVEEE